MKLSKGFREMSDKLGLGQLEGLGSYLLWRSDDRLVARVFAVFFAVAAVLTIVDAVLGYVVYRLDSSADASTSGER